MKKIFLLLIAIFALCFPVKLFAAEGEILIKTYDNIAAIESFEKELKENYGMLTRNGFGTGAYIGTPFSVEYQEAYSKDAEYHVRENDGINEYLFYFPIIRDGKIVTYVEQAVDNAGFANWAVSDWYDFKELKGGEIYSIIKDKNMNDIAVSDNEVIELFVDPDYPVDYNQPYANVETKVVNIMDRLNIDTSFIPRQTDEEAKLIKNAKEQGKTIATYNIDTLGAVNKNSRLLVPLRDVAEIVECSVDWDANTKTATVQKDNNTAEFVIGKNEYTVNGTVKTFDVPAEIYDDKTYIPIRAASEALGAEIVYNGETRKITLSF